MSKILLPSSPFAANLAQFRLRGFRDFVYGFAAGWRYLCIVSILKYLGQGVVPLLILLLTINFAP